MRGGHSHDDRGHSRLLEDSPNGFWRLENVIGRDVGVRGRHSEVEGVSGDDVCRDSGMLGRHSFDEGRDSEMLIGASKVEGTAEECFLRHSQIRGRHSRFRRNVQRSVLSRLRDARRTLPTRGKTRMGRGKRLPRRGHVGRVVLPRLRDARRSLPRRGSVFLRFGSVRRCRVLVLRRRVKVDGGHPMGNIQRVFASPHGDKASPHPSF